MQDLNKYDIIYDIQSKIREELEIISKEAYWLFERNSKLSANIETALVESTMIPNARQRVEAQSHISARNLSCAKFIGNIEV